jgi:hypothetical protein
MKRYRRKTYAVYGLRAMIEVRNSGQQAREIEAPMNRQTLPIRIRFGTSKTKLPHTQAARRS